MVFNIEEINKEVLIICSIEKENSCDTYIKNANNTGDKTKIYYQEIVEKYSSKGTQNKTIDLSGYERDLKISYEFFKEPDELIIEDRNGKVLFSTKMKTTKEEQTTEVDLKGVTQLFFKVNCSEPESKWKFSLSVK